MKKIRLIMYIICLIIILLFGYFNTFTIKYKYVLNDISSFYYYDNNEEDYININYDYDYNYNYDDSNNYDNYDNYAIITAYTPYCDGCIGITSYGYNVLNTIYYDDEDYGMVRILAADDSVPFGSIVYFYDFDSYAIVLDRGGVIGSFGNAFFDLLFDSYDEAMDFGKKEVKYKLLRSGF